MIFVQSRQFLEAIENASPAALEVSDISLSAALSASKELLLAFVVQVQFLSKDVTEAAMVEDAAKIKPVASNNEEILFMIVIPLIK